MTRTFPQLKACGQRRFLPRCESDAAFFHLYGIINEYLRRLIKGRAGKITPDALGKFKKILGEAVAAQPPTPSNDDVPF
jgi:hypothetical protein